MSESNKFTDKLTSQSNVVVMFRRRNRFNATSDVEVFDSLVQVEDSRVGLVVCTKDLFGFLILVWLVNVADYTSIKSQQASKTRVPRTCEDGQSAFISEVSQCDPGAFLKLQAVNLLLRDVQGDGHREQSAILQAERVQNAV
jgi:hypothetical protein